MIKFTNCACQVEVGKFDINHIPLDCPAVWRLLAGGHTIGVFQLEKKLGQDWSQKVRPKSLEELAALISLLRPGPLESGLSQDYVDIKFGKKKISYLHPSLKDILDSTYGCMVYQEQALRIAIDLAGFSPEMADELRKAIGKKKPELMATLKSKFVDGANNHRGISKQIAEEIFGWIEKCQRYSFNKSHAISYGMISYQTSWLKCHFPHEFFTSYLTYSQYKGDPKEEIYNLVQDSRLFGVDIFPPDIRRGNTHFQMTDVPHKGVAFGLSHIRGVGTSAIEKIITAATTQGMDPLDESIMNHGGCTNVAARTHVVDIIADSERVNKSSLATWGDFLASVPDFHRNVGIALIKSGACDCYDMQRSEMIRELEVVLGTTTHDENGHKKEIKGLTPKEREYFFDKLKTSGQTAREIISSMSKSPDPKNKSLAQMLKNELLELSNGFFDSVGICDGIMLDDGGVFLHTTPSEKIEWLKNLKSKTKSQIIELLQKNGYKDIKIKPPCSSDARRQIMMSKAEILSTPIMDTNTASATAEKHFLGISLSCSPADDADDSLSTHTCLELAQLPNNEDAVVCAIIDSVKHTKTKRGKNPGQPMCFLTVSDSTYSIDHAVVFPDVFMQLKGMCMPNIICLVYGKKQNGSFIVRDIQKLI